MRTSPETAPLTAELLGRLLPIVREINAVLEPDQLLPAIARQLRGLVDYQMLDIFLPDREGGLVPAFVAGYAPEMGGVRLREGEGIVGAAAARREPVYVADVAHDPRYVAVVPGVVSELAIPLLHRDRLVGVLNVEGSDPRAFTPEARTALQVLAGHLAVAIENATLYRETRVYASLLATLHDIAKETASILDLDQLGAFDGSEYEERTLELSPGDAFVFFTDGVVEASREGEEYGIARLRAQVESHAALRAGSLGGRILADLDRFVSGAAPADDVTFVVVKVL